MRSYNFQIGKVRVKVVRLLGYPLKRVLEGEQITLMYLDGEGYQKAITVKPDGEVTVCSGQPLHINIEIGG